MPCEKAGIFSRFYFIEILMCVSCARWRIPKNQWFNLICKKKYFFRSFHHVSSEVFCIGCCRRSHSDFFMSCHNKRIQSTNQSILAYSAFYQIFAPIHTFHRHRCLQCKLCILGCFLAAIKLNCIICFSLICSNSACFLRFIFHFTNKTKQKILASIFFPHFW